MELNYLFVRIRECSNYRVFKLTDVDCIYKSFSVKGLFEVRLAFLINIGFTFKNNFSDVLRSISLYMSHGSCSRTYFLF